MKVAIGAPTYNSFSRIEGLLTSIFTFTNYDLNEVGIVILDDGTPDGKMVSDLELICKKFKVSFIKHEKNRGIPASWNTLTKHFDSEYMILFNDDIQIHNKDWLTCFLHFMENNEKVGSAGFPLIQMDPRTNRPMGTVSLNYDGKPGRVGAPVGCSFGFKREVFNQIGGFWEKIKSFYEETDFGFRMVKLGYFAYMLSYPAMEHWGSQTFARNAELNIQDPEPELPMEEYRKIMLQKYPIKRIEPLPKKVYRMDYSRVLFAKKWNCKDYWDVPQVEVHKRILDPIQPMSVKWLDKNLQEKEDIC